MTPQHDGGLRPRTAHDPRRILRAATALALAGTLAGCAGGDGAVDVDVDWNALRDQVEQLADDAGRAAQDVRSDLEGAEVDDGVRERAENAVAEAERAVEDARARLDEVRQDATPDAARLDQAEQALADARASLESAAEDADGSVREGLETLSREIDGLLDRLREAGA